MFQAIGAVAALVSVSVVGGVCLAGIAVGIALVGWGVSHEYA